MTTATLSPINPLDLVGKQYSGFNATGYDRPEIVIGAPYLLTREWTDSVVQIARAKGGRAQGIVSYEGANWYATPVNPPVKVGEMIYALERGDGKTNPLRKDRRRVVTEVVEGGVMASYLDYDAFLVTAWVKADVGGADPKKDKHNPERRKLVLDRLSKEGMDRIGDSGYAISAREFFDTFNLPRPEVQPTALIDVEEKVAWRDMGYEMRDMFERKGLTSLRNATITGRAKVKLPRSECRCKEITSEEVMKLREARNWRDGKLHKVHCLWCMVPDSKTGTIDPEDI